MQRKLFDLTNPQKSIWYTEEVFKGTPIENITGTAIILKKVDFKLLEKSLNLFVQKNDSFRLKFILENGNVKQFVSEFTSFNVDTVLVPNESGLKSLEKDLTSIPFNTLDSLLFNFTMFEFPDGHGGFVVVMHHLISDAWTSGLLVSQIMDLYADLVKSGSTSDDISPSYIDYIESENKYLNSEKFKNDEKFWNDIFSSVPEIATIPSLKNDANSLSCKAKRKQFVIPKSTMDLINEFCKKYKVSAFNFFMGILAIYLGRVSNLDEFVIGTPILNRSNFKEKHTAGMFISVVPFKITINHEYKFSDFLSKISSDFFNIFRHQKYPYQYLLDNLRKQDSSVPHLYNILMSYQNMRSNKQSAEIEYEARWSFNNNISDDMEIHFFDINDTGDIDVAYDYKLSKYSKDDVFDIHSRIINIINQVLSNEEILLKEIEIVTPDEKNKILYEFNNTKMDYPKDKTIVELFEEQVEKTPDNIAVVFEDQKLTYRELNEKANSLGNYLLSKHVKPNEVIAIFLDKSLEMIVAILGILKAGCTYLPIDINYPDERIEFMLKDSSCRFALTSKTLSTSIDKLLETICLDLSDFDDNFGKVDTNVIAPKQKENSAYIMYTSGSTGNPKGVIVTHQNIVRLVKNTNFIKFEKKERILQTGSIVFDACTFEIWGALLNGFELYIIKKQDLLDPYLLKQYLINNKITILWLTAPLFNQLCEDNPDMFKTVRVLLTGGDVLSPKHINLVKKVCPNLTIINGYGPTENTTFSTCFTINDTYEDAIPIGFPIANSTCYVVSSNLNLLPVNVPGELLVGGDGVGKGYLNNPEYTKEKFIKNPFGEGILYKTGDLVKWREDGSIDFIGRIDNQVKIRGFRVELNEINLKIQDFSSIKECTTIVKNVNNEKVICSYFSADKVVDINDLKNFLKQSLPHYSIPTYLMQLDSLPINANGKIDVKKLPVPKIEVHNKNIILPKNDTEIELIKIIKELLNINEISMNDNFFELGGDSLSAINLSAQIQNKFSAQLFVKDILEHPVINEISDILSNKQENANIQIIKPAKEKEYYPVSSAQKRMYLASTVSGENSILYNIPGGIILDKAVEVEKLEKCLNTLVKRHDVLRTYFELNDGNVVQKIGKTIKFKLQTSEEIISSNKLKEEFDNFVKPFDLNKAPLFRAKYIKLENNKSALFIDMHHIISDGTSLSIFIDELCKLYNGETLPELSISYKDFAVWENEQIVSGNLKEAEEFWVNQFKDEIPVLNLPTNYSRPSVQSYEGNKIYSKLDKTSTEKINAICKDLGITPYMLLLSIYYILLSKYTSQETIVVGSPIVGRNISELYNIIGMFVNSLPMRAKIDSNLSFKDFVNTVKTICLENYKHQAYPFDELVEKLNISKDTSRNPLFDTMFIYQNNGNPTINLGKIKSEYYIPDTKISKFDLSLEIIPENDYLNLSFEYCTKLFDKAFIENLSCHYSNILNIVLKNLDVKLCDIDMLSEDERNKILYEFNNTKMDYPKDKTIVQLFEEQVEKTPDNIAVVFEDQKLTYRELNEKANSLGNYLKNNGVKKNDVVSIMMKPSLNTVISVLGILKSSATYLLIDNNLPEDRIIYMLSNSNSTILISHNNSKKIDFKNTIYINDIDFSANNKNLNVTTKPEDNFAIIYTSGSTGNPKGAILHNTGFVNLIYSFENMLSVSKFKNHLNMAAVSFDMFSLELFISLIFGNTIVLASEEEQKNPIEIGNIIEKNSIEFFMTTPSKMELLLLNDSTKSSLTNLKSILLGGEVFTKSLYKNMRKHTKAKIYNGYGPTEITACCSIKHITESTNINIGCSLPNTNIYILDKSMNLCPIGVPGEIYVSGLGVANGYINNPTSTKKSFISFKNTILYKTGDIGKFNQVGEIEYIGRNDFQIKLRGLRIELSEIDNVICSFDDIQKSVTVYHNSRLFAFFKATNKVNIMKLKQYLKTKLPSYMIPYSFIQIENFPVTNNGKINTYELLKQIPDIENRNIIEPKNNTEEKLLNIFKNLLDLNKISTDDEFFDIGGDSLSAIKLSVEIYNIFNKNISVKDIFNNPSIERLADLIDKTSSKKINTISKTNIKEHYPLSSAQKRIYLSSTMYGENSILYNIPGGIILDKVPDIKKLEDCLNILINRHEALRTYFVLEKDTVVQKIQDKIEFKLDIDKNILAENNIKNAYDEFVKPFDLSAAPLFRAKLIYLENNKSILFIDMHHIICDGTSSFVFADELCKLYNGETLSELSLTYKDFSVWENEQLVSGNLKEAEEFWVNQFKNDIPVLNMPTNYFRPAIKTYEGKKVYSKLNEETTKEINNICKKLDVTPYMLLLSVYYILLSKYTSQDDIIVGSPIVGRNVSELYNIIGMFVNSLPMRAKIEPTVSFKDFLNNIKNLCLENYKYQDYPFDELVNKLNIQRDISRNPLFDTMFSYQNNGTADINFNCINSQYYIPDDKISKFDLSLEIVPNTDSLDLSFEYSTKLFNKPFIENLSNHYITILNIVLENLDINLCDICMLSENEKNKILYELNNTKMDYPKDKTIAQLFEEQVEKTPDNIAVVFENQKLTYKELNEKANSLAYYLRNNEINRNDIVGIMVNRSLEMIISILAVLKAGGTYIPIDPEYPQDRIEYMLSNSNSKLLLTQKKLENNINFENKCLVDLTNSKLYSNNIINLENVNTPEDLAYIIYTSGSTGLPKGVMLKNINIVNFIYATIKALDLKMDNTVVSITTISFDIFVLESLLPLLNGMKIVIASEKAQTDATIFNDLCEKHKVEVIQTTPSRIQAFLNDENFEKFISKVKYLLIGGEPFPKQLLEKLHSICCGKIYNMYGPTETAVWSSVKDLTSSNEITIGKPIGNTQMYILDRFNIPLPQGVPGELFIAGDGVCSGYFNNINLTNKVFINNPFEKNSKIYKTGDFCKLLPNGEFEYLERIDNQVKIRGLRIELGEIENKILSYQNIKKACVIKQTINNRDFISAYFTANKRINISELRKYLSNSLPKYMIPSYFTVLEDFSYTPNGKINKKALPLPKEILDSDSKREYIAPKTKLEKQIISIWEQILNISPIGVTDNFFEMG